MAFTKAQAKKFQTALVAKGFVLTIDGDFGGKSYAALMAHVGAKKLETMHLDLGKAAAVQFPAAKIDMPLRLAHCLAQSSVETRGFTTLVESLNYSVVGLLNTFGRHRLSAADAERLGRNLTEASPLSMARQDEIANLVYGGDWGRAKLGNMKAGDGARYKGRGTKQTTGLSNYQDVERVTGLNVVADPFQLADPVKGTKAGCVFWTAKSCNVLADADDINALTVRINGGSNGLTERKNALLRAKAILL